MNRFESTNDWLKVRASLTPDATALFIGGRSWTFIELDALASRMAHWLHENNIKPVNHVGLLMANSLAAVACIFALARLGAVLVPLNTRLTPSELAWQIERADCVALLCTTDLEEPARTAVEERIPIMALPRQPIDLEKVSAHYPVDSRSGAASDPTATQAIVFTSGTTGFPKGVIISYANHYWSAVGSAKRLDSRLDDHWLACLPLYHIGGLAILFRSCLYGTAVVLHNGFDMPAVMNSLRTEAVTLVSLVPTMLGRLLHAGLTLAGTPSLRLILLGGAAAPPGVLAEAAAADLLVVATYGSTETTSQTATMEPERAMDKPGSVGKPIPSVSVAILDDAGNEAPRDTPGEIVVKGPNVMSGYYNDPIATAEKLRSGWLHTGDIGYLDGDGDLWVLDRRSDLIVSGGENVYPAEVERVLREHPAVSQVCVVGLPHPDWGQQVAAIVVPSAPGQFDEDGLLLFSRGRLAGFKQPRAVYIVEQLPQTGSGKINRRAAAEQLANRLASE